MGFDFIKEKENHQANYRDYRLPDGNVLKLGSEKSKAPEILFKPELIGLEYPGVHEMVASCI
jgi:centractin